MTGATTLKTYFETGDRPTASQFAELIDSLHPEVVTLGTFDDFVRDHPTIRQALADLVTAIIALQTAIGDTVHIQSDATLATLKLSDLPTTDPIDTGMVWNDNGTLRISAG